MIRCLDFRHRHLLLCIKWRWGKRIDNVLVLKNNSLYISLLLFLLKTVIRLPPLSFLYHLVQNLLDPPPTSKPLVEVQCLAPHFLLENPFNQRAPSLSKLGQKKQEKKIDGRQGILTFSAPLPSTLPSLRPPEAPPTLYCPFDSWSLCFSKKP